MEIILNALTNPSVLSDRKTVLSPPFPVPEKRGLYAWFFRAIPKLVPTDDCITKDGLTLLYVGISPKNEESKENLKRRIKYHYQGNAEGSTLRRTLGVLLTSESGFPLRRVGSGNRTTFTHVGEQWLDQWMERNAFVCWVEHERPWDLEHLVFEKVSLPLNIQDNSHNPFAAQLSQLRQQAKIEANDMAVAVQAGQRRG
jgi:hypothetical protein